MVKTALCEDEAGSYLRLMDQPDRKNSGSPPSVLGFGVQGLGLRVWGFGFRVSVLRFRL